MNYTRLLILMTFVACHSSGVNLKPTAILERSVAYHDPQHLWESTRLNIHIQEPRLNNPLRHSIVTIAPKGKFELHRNKGKHIATYRINDSNEHLVFLDGEVITDSLKIKQYRLESKRVVGYQKFYKTMLGLPMVLPKLISDIEKVSETTFNQTACYQLQVRLKEALFSKHWLIYISKTSYNLLGIEMVFPEDPNKGERLYFDKEIIVNNIRLPRVRHWYGLDNSYSGSDIIVKHIK